MATANEKILDAEISHQIDLHQYSNGVVRKIIGVLNRTDGDLFAQLNAALERLDPDSFTVDRLESLLRSVRAINVQAYQAVGKELTSEMRGLVGAETAFQHDLFLNVLPVQLQLNTVTVESAYAAAMSRPFQGRLLKEWTSSIEADRMARIRDTVRIGYVEGLPTSEIVRRVRGTRAKGFSDGIIEIDRRHAEAVVRTSVGHTAGTTRERFHDANADLIKALGWTSTLDSRTSAICRIRDGKQYHPKTHAPIGHKLPWLGGPGKAHWNCRSCAVPVLKSWKELGAAADIEEFSPATRASMDGQVPADQTYGEWLKKQSPARQDQILGKARGEMFRRGGLTLDKFYNDKGQWLTLEQLQAKAVYKAPPPPVPSPLPARATFDTSTEAGRWHQKAFDAAPDWLRDVVARQHNVQVEFSGGGAYAVRALAINMGEVRVDDAGRMVPAIESLARQSIWRHEFGHILDARLAAGQYRSSERDFPVAQHNDAILLEAAAGKGRPSKALAAAQDRRAAEYQRVVDTVVDAADREKALEGIANRAGVDYKRFMTVVAESTLLENTGVGFHVRIGRMLKAIELGDAEEFIRQAVFLTPEDLKSPGSLRLQERSWRKDGAFAALSDLVGSATRNRVAGQQDLFFGHSDAYYARAPLFAPTESFANLTALAGHRNAYWWELVKRFAPNMAREFEAIIRKVT